ncbi:chromo domain-containing protein, partial [Cylindrospermopsis raciborskii]|uniref:chromo domain-containing protein n=1 Tax=Cylindrospermopsis raciborskii TaxID=77022 RepID=UPI0022C13AA4
FGRGYDEQSVQEVFKIHSIDTKFPKPMYVISNYRGDEIIKGKFYQNELVRFNGTFRIEKVLKRRVHKGKNQIYVKWKGYDSTYNEWIDEENVTQTF